MEWTEEAEKAIKKVPFFVRKKVRARVEDETVAAGRKAVTIPDIKTTKKRYLTNMSSEIKGFQIDTCFGSDGCPNRAVESNGLFNNLENLLAKEDILKFLKQNIGNNIKFHHEFRVTLANCPNACSQPQIKDIGIIGASIPEITENECILCGQCVDICNENAVALNDKEYKPEIDYDLCIKCGQCIKECPTATISEKETGFRILLGGKLGRHPRLAEELPGIFNEDKTLKIVKKCIDYYKKNSKNGARFANIYNDRQFLKNPENN
ncbi:MAG: 4Fe-4S binding protein [Deltaproteobacteria bacterium]|nr:4Fe-4S binding protein [Deltaproteobacteria bacterium]